MDFVWTYSVKLIEFQSFCELENSIKLSFILEIHCFYITCLNATTQSPRTPLCIKHSICIKNITSHTTVKPFYICA